MYIKLSLKGDGGFYPVNTKYFADVISDLIDENGDIIDSKQFVYDILSAYKAIREDERATEDDSLIHVLMCMFYENAPDDNYDFEEYDIAYKMVVDGNDAIRIYDERESNNVLNDDYCVEAVIENDNVELYTIKLPAQIIYIHDHLNKYGVYVDVRFSSYYNHPDIDARNDRYFYAPNFIDDSYLYWVIDRYLNGEECDKKYTWDELEEKGFIDSVNEAFMDVLDNYGPNGSLPFDETKYVYELKPTWDVSINVKKRLITIRDLSKKTFRLYRSFANEEEYKKGWFFDMPKFGKDYVILDKDKGITVNKNV